MDKIILKQIEHELEFNQKQAKKFEKEIFISNQYKYGAWLLEWVLELLKRREIKMKNIQKSIRISDEIFEIVMKQPGQGFSEKFENLVRKFAYAEKDLDRRLAEKQDDVKRLSQRVSDYHLLLNALDDIRSSVDILLKKCNSI